MATLDLPALWQRFDRAEQGLCLRVNRGCRYLPLHRFFAAVSRLGDGVFWYGLMLALALNGPAEAEVALQMAVAALAGVLIYGQLKHRLVRERPFVSHAGIRLGAAPLDRYSFPSGHTLHAVCFTTIAIAHIPELGPAAGALCRGSGGLPSRARPALPDGRGRRRAARPGAGRGHAVGDGQLRQPAPPVVREYRTAS